MTGHNANNKRGLYPAVAALLAALVLAGCGGASVQSNPQQQQTDTNQYAGPQAATDDVQAFRVNLWENIRSNGRCGGCHDAGGQSPTFANSSDVNQAYAAANKVVNLNSPEDSLMVTKVAGGHNCWLQSDQACADMLEQFIANWAGGASGATTRVELKAPTLKDPGSSRSFPDDSSLFGSTVHQLLTQHCSGCHSPDSATPEQPYFADGDVDAAYEAVKPKIDLDTPANSRLVVRLRDEFHNCWSDCASNADIMQTAIENMTQGITPVSVDPSLVSSRALDLGDGLVASAGGRYESNLVAFYEFKTGQGSIAYDTSGVEPALNLNLSGDVSWVGGYGIRINDGKAQGSTTASAKLNKLITATGEYSVEAWVVPANVTQEGPARIVSYSGGNDIRNFTLGQSMYNYDFLNRGDTTDPNGEPALSTPDGDEALQATLQHVVLTFDPVGGRRIYVNGELASQTDPQAGGGITGWNDTFALVLGNEVSSERLWKGSVRLLAIYNRALTPAQIQQNFAAGVGQKFYLLFHVGKLLTADTSDPAYESYILFEVSRFDQYSYLFDRPYFVNLNTGYAPDGIRVKGMRLGINGKEAQVGQAYANLDTTVTAAEYDYQNLGQQLSRMGTIIALQKGPDSDEFFLTFDQLGMAAYARTPPAVPTPAAPADGDPQSVLGVRTFDEINATMSTVTGIPRDNTAVRDTFERIKQQLPTSEDITGYLSAHQMGVAQLAIEYCSALVDDPAARGMFFGSFGFDSAVGTAFGSYTGDTPEKHQIVDALYDHFVGQNLTTAPTRAEVYTELADPANTGNGTRPANLFSRLTQSCATSCDAQRTRNVVKALCAATLSSATVVVQ